MSTILIGGYYGAGNIGDEAILTSIINALRANNQGNKKLNFIVLSWNPELTSAEHEVEAIHWKDIPTLIEKITNTNLVILGGGGLFFDYWGIDPNTYLRKSAWDITAYGSLPLLAKIMDIPCMIYAVGVGPLKSELARHHTLLAFMRSQIATVRDEKSLALLREIGLDEQSPGSPLVKMLPDPVYGLETSSEDDDFVDRLFTKNGINQNQLLLGVSLRYWDFDGPLESWLPNIAKGLKQFLTINPNVNLLLIPFQNKEEASITNDTQVLKFLMDLINLTERTYLIEDDLTPTTAQALIKRCKVILGMRMHSVIMAINERIPVIALSYDPKVASVMKTVKLEKFCNLRLNLSPEQLLEQIQTAWVQEEQIRHQIEPIIKQLSQKATINAQIAMSLLSNENNKKLSFNQAFILEQIKLIHKIDETYKELESEKESLQNNFWDLQLEYSKVTNEKILLQTEISNLKAEISNLKAENQKVTSELNTIKASRVWKLGQRYYHIRDSTPLRYIYRFLVVTKQEGLSIAFRKTFNHLRGYRRTAVEISTKIDARANLVMDSFVSKLNKRSLKGVFVLTSTFEFDEFYNQRVINLSKYLASHGWGVIYVAWVWQDEREAPPQEIKENIFQVPLNFFLLGYSNLQKLVTMRKYFVVEFPNPDFLSVALQLRSHGFSIIYDIIDEWEAFHQVDQAHWYQKNFEESIVLNANYLTAVSKPLIEKFSRLRKDIHLIPNGFDPAFLGDFQSISKQELDKSNINLGYFGHLTPAWFDWKFIKEILDQAKINSINLKVHIIGYGEPDLSKMLVDYKDSLAFHGRVPPSNLYKYVKNWDLAMIPFKIGKLSEAVDPIKIYEYLYFGLPVIVKGIPHLEDLPNVSVVDNVRQFFEVLNNLSESNKYQRQSIDPLEFTWEKRFYKFLKILEDETWMSL